MCHLPSKLLCAQKHFTELPENLQKPRTDLSLSPSKSQIEVFLNVAEKTLAKGMGHAILSPSWQGSGRDHMLITAC